MATRFLNPIIKYTTTISGPMPETQLYFYVNGTTTLKATYQDFNLTMPHTHPVEALSDGHFPPIFLNGTYRAELKINGITQPGWPVDDVGITEPLPFAVWSSGYSYSQGDLVTGSDRNRYESLQSNNLNNNPSGPGSLYWSQVSLSKSFHSQKYSSDSKYKGSESKTGPEPTEKYSSNTLTSAAPDVAQNNAPDKSRRNLLIGATSLVGAIGAIATTAFVQSRDKSFQNGSEALPSISFSSDPDTGMYLKSTNSVSISTGGTDRVVVTSRGRSGFGTESPSAKLHAEVKNDDTCGIRSTCYWTGSSATPYQNNDCSLFEVFNDVQSDSRNLSWAVSASNAANNIPLGVTDTGNRVGVYGWAVSVPSTDYSHAGTLEFQFGVWGKGGFLKEGSPATGVVNHVVGVRGEIVNDSVGSTIVTAIAGEFISNASTGNVQHSYAVRASASNGIADNWSFHGDAGQLFNQDKALFGSKFSEMNSNVSVRDVGNAYEFGFPSSGGYGSSLGVMPSCGAPFLSLCAEVDPVKDTFTTRGKHGHVIYNNLYGSLIFARTTQSSAGNQKLAEAFRVDENGRVQFQDTPIISAFAPTSSTAKGQTGQIAWDSDYIYVCVGTNQWKRTPLSTW